MRRLAVAYGIGLVPALVMSLDQPVWSRVDEAAHYDVIAQYAAGVYPHDSVTTIRPETLDVMERTGVYSFVVDNAFQRPDVSEGFQAVPPGLSDAAHVLWIRRHVYQFSYEAFQPPLYYAAAVPAWLLGSTLGGPLGAVYAVRIFDALLAALLAPMSMFISLLVWPANRAAAWVAATMTAVLPGVAVNLTSVTNDVLVSVLGAACLLVAISGRWSSRRVIVLGLLFGAALLTKTTAVGIAPALAIALLQKERGGGLRPLVGAGAIGAACFGPWIASNFAIYGEVVTTREQLAMSAFPTRTADPAFWTVSTLHAFTTFWTGDPFLSFPGVVPLAFLAAFIVGLSLAGLWHLWRRGSEGVSRWAALVVGAAAVGAGIACAASPLLAAFSAAGRLAYVGVCATVVLVVIGLWVELPSPRLRRAVIGLFTGLCVLELALLALLIYPASPAPSNPGRPVIAHSQPLFATGSFAGVMVTTQTCAIDTAGDVWLEVSLLNAGNSPAEWSQTLEIDAGTHNLANSDYRRSAQLPMTLLPGYGYSGWFWIGHSSWLQRHADTTIRLRDVAAEGYQQIGDIVMRTPLC